MDLVSLNVKQYWLFLTEALALARMHQKRLLVELQVNDLRRSLYLGPDILPRVLQNQKVTKARYLQLSHGRDEWIHVSALMVFGPRMELVGIQAIGNINDAAPAFQGQTTRAFIAKMHEIMRQGDNTKNGVYARDSVDKLVPYNFYLHSHTSARQNNVIIFDLGDEVQISMIQLFNIRMPQLHGRWWDLTCNLLNDIKDNSPVRSLTPIPRSSTAEHIWTM